MPEPAPASITIDPRPRAAADDATAALRGLLRVEAELRRADTRERLGLALVNEGRKLARARQVFLFALGAGRRATARVERVSGLATMERDSPLVRWLQETVEARLRAAPSAAPDTLAIDLRASEGAAARAAEAATYPFPHGLWVPLKDRVGRAAAGFLLTRESPFSDEETALAVRLAETGAHALLALEAAGRPSRLRETLRTRRGRIAAGLAAAALCALALPVPLTVLAPAEIVAERPYVVSAPLDGVVEEIAVPPNGAVAAGDVVVRYVDTALRNGFQVAERDVAVAEARLRQSMQAAFFDEKARREVGQARAELALKAAERDYARDLFARTQVRAERTGVAVYADRKEWFGKPVSTGQRILEIADPRRVEVRVDLPVSDAVPIGAGARVRVFLDSDPLNPVEAQVSSATPLARLTEAGVLAHRVTARLAASAGDGAGGLRGAVGEGAEAPPDARLPRLGMRGTAQIFGERVPLGLFLFRKPLAWARQKAGL